MTEPIFTQDELNHLCRDVHSRMRAAVAVPSAAEAKQALAELLAPSRRFLEIIHDWAALTYEHVLDRYGVAELSALLQPDRVAELAARAGMSLDDLVLSREIASTPRSSLVATVEAHLDDGEPSAALAACTELWERTRMALALRRDVVSDALGRIYRRHGVEALEAAQLHAAERGWWKRYMPAYRTTGPKRRLEQRLEWLTLGSGADVRAVELQDRWVVTLLRCGTCGDQLRTRYADDRWGLEVVHDDGAATFGGGAATVYQSHVAIIHHRFAIDLVGAPCPAFRCSLLDAGARPCEIHVFKDLDDTDAWFYEAVGCRVPAVEPAG